MDGEIGIFSFSDAQAIYDATILGQREFKEHSRPSGGRKLHGLVLITPSGGIAARSGSTISNAVCTIVNRSGSTISTGTETFTVWNMSTTAVAGNAYIGVLWTNIGWKAVWEDC